MYKFKSMTDGSNDFAENSQAWGMEQEDQDRMRYIKKQTSRLKSLIYSLYLLRKSINV